jgi:predicted nucleic acid-binding protein
LTVLVDSSAWIEYFKGTRMSREIELILFSEEELVASSVTVAEVYRYLLVNSSEQADKCIQFLLERSFVIPITTEIAKQTARLQQTHKFSLADAFIMTTARIHDAKILTCDADFKKEPDVIYLSSK